MKKLFSRLRLPAAAIVLCTGAWAQPPRQFDVASVKPAPPPETYYMKANLGAYEGGKLTFDNASLADCLKYAYAIPSDIQLIAPDWIWARNLRFDIVALTSPETPREQVEPMLQHLLADRFKVVLHHEQRNLPYMAMIPDKKGPKVTVSKLKTPGTGKSSVIKGHVHGQQISMRLLASMLSRYSGQIILDRTSLTKYYDLDLYWTPDDTVQPKTDSDYPSLATALREQLGLRLESRKGPLDVLVLDSAEKTPTPN